MVARSLAVAAAAVVLAGLVAPSAHADSERFSDPRGDTVQRPAMTVRSSADVVRTVGRHADGRMAVTATVADLTATDMSLRVSLITSEGPFFTQTGRRGGESFVLLYDEDFALVRCPGLRGGLRPAADRASVSVPRRCLDRPAWIRFGAATAVTTPGGESYRADDVRRRGIRQEGTLTIGRTRLRHD